MVDFQDLTNSLDEQNEAHQGQVDKETQLDAVKESGNTVASAVTAGTDKVAQGLKDVSGKVEVTNPDLAKSQDVNQAVEAINKLNLTTFMQNEGLPKLAQNLADLSDKTEILQDKMENEGLKKMSDQLSQVVSKLSDLSKTLSKTEISVDTKLQKTIDNLSKRIEAINFNPAVNVSAPETKVVTTPIDLKPVLAALDRVEKACSTMEMPDSPDLSPIVGGLDKVVQTIGSLTFPSTNYVLPFKDPTGKATQLELNSDGSLPLNGPWTPYLANAITTTVIVSNGPGKFGGYMLINLNSSPAYLQVFDTVGAITLGTTTPTFVIPIPANTTAANGVAANLELADGVIINNNIRVAATTTATGASTVATGVTGSIWYK